MDVPCDAPAVACPGSSAFNCHYELTKSLSQDDEGSFCKKCVTEGGKERFLFAFTTFCSKSQKKQRERKKSTEIFSPNESDNGAKS